MADLTIAELEDEPGKVYVIGLGPEQPESVRSWFHSESNGGFKHWWKKNFQNAGVIVLPGEVEFGEVTELDAEEVEGLIENEME